MRLPAWHKCALKRSPSSPGYAAATSSSNKSFERGTLVSNRSAVNSGASPYEREGWRLDGVNNWNQFGSNTGGASIGTSIESTAFNEWNLAGSTPGYAGYDDNGNAETYNNVASGGPGVYRWDAWNRLRDVEDQYSQKVAEYFYDAHNRRVRKVVAYGGVENSADVLNGTTDYAYQGWRVLWENFAPEVTPFAPSGGPTTFVYGNTLDEAWSMMESDEAEIYSHFYFLSGVNYSVMGVIDAYNTNALAEAYEYDPYGRHRVISPGTDATYFTSDDTYDEMHPGAINNSIRYTGQRFDAESNLMYYKNRYYDPAAGRFIGRDPLGWRAGANRYGYVDANPVMKMDPDGQNPYNPRHPPVSPSFPDGHLPDIPVYSPEDWAHQEFLDEEGWRCGPSNNIIATISWIEDGDATQGWGSKGCGSCAQDLCGYLVKAVPGSTCEVPCSLYRGNTWFVFMVHCVAKLTFPDGRVEEFDPWDWSATPDYVPAEVD